MNFLWISHEFPVNFLWISYEFPMNFLWISYEFPMDFLWISYGFPMNFLWISGVPKPSISDFSTGALMVAMRRANEPDVSDAHPGMELDSASAENTMIATMIVMIILLDTRYMIYMIYDIYIYV